MSLLKINDRNCGFTVTVADSRRLRTFGWIGRRIALNASMHLIPCNCIHTFGMIEAIDVIFLNEDNKVIFIISNLKPWNITPRVTNAHSVLEMKSGAVEKLSIQLGYTVSIHPQPV